MLPWSWLCSYSTVLLRVYFPISFIQMMPNRQFMLGSEEPGADLFAYFLLDYILYMVYLFRCWCLSRNWLQTNHKSRKNFWFISPVVFAIKAHGWLDNGVVLLLLSSSETQSSTENCFDNFTTKVSPGSLMELEQCFQQSWRGRDEEALKSFSWIISFSKQFYTLLRSQSLCWLAADIASSLVALQ